MLAREGWGLSDSIQAVADRYAEDGYAVLAVNLFGGHWSLCTALAAGKGVNATVISFGAPIADGAQIARLQSPVLGQFGEMDTGSPLDRVRAMETQIGQAGQPVTIDADAHANHAFANPSR